MTNKTPFLLALCIAAGLVLLACGGGADNTANTANTANAGNTNKATNTAANTSTTSGDKVGVPECDDYIAKYEACVNGKVPEMARAQFNSSMKTLRDAWRKAASTPEGKAGLAAACKQAAEQAKSSMKPYGCDF